MSKQWSSVNWHDWLPHQLVGSHEAHNLVRKVAGRLVQGVVRLTWALKEHEGNVVCVPGEI